MIEIRALRADDNRDDFRSGDVDLVRFFHKFAGQNQLRLHIGTTYVVVKSQKSLDFQCSGGIAWQQPIKV